MARVFLHDQTRDTNENSNGGRLTVNCASGSSVRISCGQTTYTAVANSSNKVIFEGLQHGVWTIGLVGSSNTKNIEIVTDYEVVIDFFTATIVVDYPSGSTCTCTNGIVTYTAPDDSGLWYCTATDVGTWTITCTDGVTTKHKNVEILDDGSYVNVRISYFTATINVTYPNGALCSCANEDTVYSASNTSGNWSFVVYKAGNWTITASDGVQKVTSIVNVSYDGQVTSTTIKFFAATIDITYPKGAVCMCTDGITTFTAQDTSGRWIVTVPRTGTWTIRSYKGNGDVTQTVQITEDGQNESVVCEFFIAYIDVTYPSETFKVVLWYVNDYGTKEEIEVATSSAGNHIFVVDRMGSYEVGIYRVAPYAGIESEAKDYACESVSITNDKQTSYVSMEYITVPEFTYTGTYEIVDDSGKKLTGNTGDWNIRFLTTGNLRFTKLYGAANGIDVFVLGGGGDGGEGAVKMVSTWAYCSGGGGGGGGQRSTAFKVQVNTTEPYEIVVGGSNGSSSAFGTSASGGGKGGSANSGSGGEGGTGGSNGGKGGYNANAGTNGEDGTYAFIGSSGYKYGAGGGGGRGNNGETGVTGPVNRGGADGGGDSATNGDPNSGGGGGGENQTAQYTHSGIGKGGSGIVIIRNKR